MPTIQWLVTPTLQCRPRGTLESSIGQMRSDTMVVLYSAALAKSLRTYGSRQFHDVGPRDLPAIVGSH